MPPKPKTIKLTDLDETIKDVLKNFQGGKLPGLKGPIINGIILKESALQGVTPLALAKEITKSLTPIGDVTFKAKAQILPDKKVIVGFVIGPKN